MDTFTLLMKIFWGCHEVVINSEIKKKLRTVKTGRRQPQIYLLVLNEILAKKRVPTASRTRGSSVLIHNEVI